ncbi:MAG: CDP-diacylglycerol--glycerol-3-phosphate 3-phosphatidyltransferase [Clostridiales bacterium]|nr:CDP-diacylglycerol--glycerol-3-phosphate 3-phosphatidyltransferase [Clostridiales bacterium]
MNTPNILTIVRVVLMPVFLALMLLDGLSYHYTYAVIVFAAASVTDWIDGYLARKNAQVTNFGKFLDPLADKILTSAALLCLMQIDLCSIWVVMIVLTREFLVTSIRLIAAAQGEVIAANMWGKVKTFFQMFAMTAIFGLLALGEFGIGENFPLRTVSHVLMWMTAAVTAVSGVKYLWDNRRLINTTK